MTPLTIAVCTYRRASLTDTLASLMRLDLPEGVAPEVLVIDNDDSPSARSAVETFAATAPLGLRHVHAPARNISVARNAALDASRARYLAFIDDDETATPGWLAALLARKEATGADVILGPVRAIYPDGAPAWMRLANLHGAAPVVEDGQIRTGYSGNVLIDRTCPALRGLRFDLALGRTGGEDTMFFAAAHKAGARIEHAPDALVTEPVPPARLAARWLVARRLRTGRTHAMRLLTLTDTSRPAALAVAAAKIGAAAMLAALVLPSARHRTAALLRLVFHTGVALELARPEARPTAALKEVGP